MDHTDKIPRVSGTTHLINPLLYEIIKQDANTCVKIVGSRNLVLFNNVFISGLKVFSNNVMELVSVQDVRYLSRQR